MTVGGRAQRGDLGCPALANREKRDCFVPRNDKRGGERSVAISVLQGRQTKKRDCFVPRNDKRGGERSVAFCHRERSVAISVVQRWQTEKREIASCLAMTKEVASAARRTRLYGAGEQKEILLRASQ